ncbi:MAG: hypothetical protein PHR68_02930 [Candidatus Gracilibacteria bacterium]|nr:hypothetical protein [Candidatus Gracilibacteria bacterium]
MAGLENINILSIGGFIFFLLIFLVGYIFVEILLGKSYCFRSNFERYENNLFDRIIHYISWGMLLNIGYLILWLKIDGYKLLAESFDNSGKLSEALLFIGDSRDLQLIFFSIGYFIPFIIILTSVILVLRGAINFYKIFDFIYFLYFYFIKNKTSKGINKKL